MGCCQTNYEIGELVVAGFNDRDPEKSICSKSGEEFAELSLESREEETELNLRYTEQAKSKDYFTTVRSTSYSLHRFEIEQSFLQTKPVRL